MKRNEKKKISKKRYIAEINQKNHNDDSNLKVSDINAESNKNKQFKKISKKELQEKLIK